MPSELANAVPGDLSGGPAAQLVDVLAQLHLLDDTQHDETVRQLQPQFGDARSLARELIRRGWLTPYQVNQLFLGRGNQLLLGSYILLERLGEGGMGQVFKARHQTLGRIAALKVIRKDRLSNREALHRFQREIQAVSQLSHPNVVVAFDADQAGDTHFFAMEYVEGIDLGQLVKRSGPLGILQACDFIRQGALGLHHAHERGLIHRDIKPSNLLLSTKDQLVKVLDLGLARLERDADGDPSTTLTQQGSLMGTPDFIAPEQARNSHRIDARADIYSLGCTFYYLLTGQVPFQAETSTEKLYKHWFEEPKPLEELRSEVPPATVAVVRRLMAKKPEDRYQSAALLAAALTPGAENADTLVGTATPVDHPSGDEAPVAVPVAVMAESTMPEAVPMAVAAPSTISEPPVPQAMSARDTMAPFRVPVGRPRLPLMLGVGAALLGVFAVVVFVLAFSKKPKPLAQSRRETTEAPRTREQQADADLQPLLSRFGDPKADDAALRRDLIAYRIQYADLPQATKAAHMIGRLASPFDQLPPNIPKEERFEGPRKYLWAVAGDKRRRHWGPARAVVLSPDGRTIASGGDDGVRLWSVKTGREQAALATGSVQALAFVGDSNVLLCATVDGPVTLWDVVDEKRVNRLSGPVRPGTAIAFSGDGKFVAQGQEDGTVRVWNIGTDKELPRPTGHNSAVHSLTFSPDGKSLASAGEDKLVKGWNVATGKELFRLAGHDGAVRALAFGAEGQTLASGSDDRTIRLWDVAKQRTKQTMDGLDAGTSALAITANGKTVLSGSDDGAVHFWDAAKGTERVAYQGHTDAISSLVYRADGQLLASAGTDGLIRLWDVASEEELSPLGGHTSAVLSVAVSPDARHLATASADHTIRLWETGTLKERAILKGHSGEVSSLSFSGDGQRLASGSWDGRVKLWDMASTKERDTLGGHRGKVQSVAFSLDGKTLAAGSGSTEPSPTGAAPLQIGEVKLWDVGASNRERTTMRRFHRDAVTAVALTPSGKIGLSASFDGTLKFWDWATGRERNVIDAKIALTCAAFNPGGNVVAAGTRKGGVLLYDANSRANIASLSGLTAEVSGLAFALDNQSLLGADLAGHVVLWDWPSRKILLEWQLPGAVHGVAFAPDGRHFITANGNGTIFLFRLKPYTGRQ
ncbi:MAG: protein kinase [Gemmataceae bacterium]|nr:protein kinase [Gemmataceae bacterium]